jgi:hypothetical protein
MLACPDRSVKKQSTADNVHFSVPPAERNVQDLRILGQRSFWHLGVARVAPPRGIKGQVLLIGAPIWLVLGLLMWRGTPTWHLAAEGAATYMAALLVIGWLGLWREIIRALRNRPFSAVHALAASGILLLAVGVLLLNAPGLNGHSALVILGVAFTLIASIGMAALGFSKLEFAQSAGVNVGYGVSILVCLVILTTATVSRVRSDPCGMSTQALTVLLSYHLTNVVQCE